MHPLTFACYFLNPLIAGDIHVASFITCFSLRVNRLRVFDCLHATRAGRQLRRQRVYGQSLQQQKGHRHSNLQFVVPASDRATQKKRAVQVVLLVDCVTDDRAVSFQIDFMLKC